MKQPTAKISGFGYKLFLITVFCLSSIIHTLSAYAAPIPEQTVYTRYNKQNIYIQGDEHYQQFYVLGEDGQHYTVVQGQDEKWYYATNDATTGALIVGKSEVERKVGRPRTSENLFSTGGALASIRARQETFKNAMERNNTRHLDTLAANRSEDRGIVYQTHIVFVEFPETSHIYEADDFLQMAFSYRNTDPYTQTPNGYQAHGSARDYWEEVSRGEVDIEPIVHFPVEGKWFLMPETREYYEIHCDPYTEDFHNEVIAETGIDITEDDFLIVVAAGRAISHSSNFWPHVAGYQFGSYSRMLLTERFRIYGEDDRFLAMGVVAHEFGHMLFGLRDYGYSVHYWGLMGMGAYGYGPGGYQVNDPEKPAHLCAITRKIAGFADMETISGEGALQMQYTLPAVELTGKILHLVNQDYDTDFYLECRQPFDNVFDSDIGKESAGMVVWFTFDDNEGFFQEPFSDPFITEKVGYLNASEHRNTGGHWSGDGYWGQVTRSAFPGPYYSTGYPFGYYDNTEIGFHTIPSFTGNLYTSLHRIVNIEKLFLDLEGTANAAFGLGVQFDLQRFYFDEDMFLISLDDDNQGASQGNGNGVPEVGERVEAVFTIVNGSDIAMPQTDAALLTDEDLDWVSDTFIIPQILPGEFVDTPVTVFDILTEPVSGDHYYLDLLRSDNFTFTTTGLFGVPLQPGWPQATGSYINSSPSLADLDNDGDMEIVIGSDDHKVYAWYNDGTLLDGWPVETGDYVNSSPAIADIDNDGDKEIIVGSYDDKVYAWHHDATPVAGWPIVTDSDIHASPAIVDIDGDSDLEIVVATTSPGYVIAGSVYIWHHDGTPVEGWPQRPLNIRDSFYASPAVVDLDNDGMKEIIIGSNFADFYVWHADGTIMEGWPVDTNAFYGVDASAAVADLDGDSDLEIIVGLTFDYSSHKANVYAWHHDGSVVAGWPQETLETYENFESSPAVADLDGDGVLEIAVASSFRGLYLWHANGTSVEGWPAQEMSIYNNHRSSPAIADIDDDPDLEIVIGSSDANVYAFNYDASLVTGWPTPTGGSVASSPAIADIDNDGVLEIVVGSGDHKVYAWSFGLCKPGEAPWPMFRHDLERTGVYAEVEKEPVSRTHYAVRE
ncbi:FG-GAP-like repeat-containing protein [Candidatus Omnitrophota bacterium]